MILTGVSFKAGQIGLAHFNQQSGSVTYHMSKAYPHHFLEQVIYYVLFWELVIFMAYRWIKQQK